MSIKSFFFEDTEDKPKEVKSEKVDLKTVSSNQPITPNISNVPQQELDKFISHFDEIFDKANIPGPDYFEFSKMIQAMGNLTEDVKFPAVFSALKIQGLSKQKLIDTASQYIKVLEDDEKQFTSLLDTKVLGDINNKKLALTTNKETIKKKEELIAKLQEELINDKQNISTLESEISIDEKKYKDKIIVYKSASDNRKSLINSDIEKINRIL